MLQVSFRGFLRSFRHTGGCHALRNHTVLMRTVRTHLVLSSENAQQPTARSKMTPVTDGIPVQQGVRVKRMF